MSESSLRPSVGGPKCGCGAPGICSETTKVKRERPKKPKKQDNRASSQNNRSPVGATN